MIRLNYLVRKIKELIPFINTPRGPFYEFKTKFDADKVYSTLIPFGWQINYISYHEKDEILGLRKLYDVRQIHLRLFKDGEVRIHDEYNYDFYPVKHMHGEDFKPADRATVTQLKEMLSGE